MSATLDIFISREQIKAAWLRSGGHYSFREISSALDAFTEELEEIMAEKETPDECVIYLAEEILFYSQFSLDRQTPDIRGAIHMQLEMISPYGQESLYAYELRRDPEDKSFVVSLYAAERAFVEPYLRQINGLGLRLMGMFPESQRYVTRQTRKMEWGLWVPGRFGKLLIFKEGRMVERLQCPVHMDAAQLQERSGLDTIYALSEVEGFTIGSPLLAEPARGQRFDLLPKSYRRPDYLKGVIIALLGVNLFLLLLLGATKMVGVNREAARVAAEIEELRPQVAQVEQLRSREQELEQTIARFQDVEANKDFIQLLAMLTRKLPATSYLDQMRLDKSGDTIHLQGYTEDLAQLTSTLQEIGHATLKSTRKRRNQTYFHVEVALP